MIIKRRPFRVQRPYTARSRSPVGVLAGRKSVGAGQMVLPRGDSPADGAHARGPSSGLESCGRPFVGAQCRAWFACRFRVGLDEGVRVVAGDPGVERDQVVLGGRLGLLEGLSQDFRIFTGDVRSPRISPVYPGILPLQPSDPRQIPIVYSPLPRRLLPGSMIGGPKASG